MSRMARSATSSLYSSVVGRHPDSSELPVLHVVGSLHASQSTGVRQQVQALLHRGERTIVLSLTGATAIDAAGMGELVRAYNTTRAAAGRLRVTGATGLVRELLERVGLLQLLTAAD